MKMLSNRAILYSLLLRLQHVVKLRHSWNQRSAGFFIEILEVSFDTYWGILVVSNESNQRMTVKKNPSRERIYHQHPKIARPR